MVQLCDGYKLMVLMTCSCEAVSLTDCRLSFREPGDSEHHTDLERLLNFLFLCVLGCGGRVRVLRQAAAGDSVLRTELLRRVRQRWSHDERRRDPHVLLPGTVQTLLQMMLI